jgi:TetR/AcrR family tetracycline transcriptional repressor
MKPGPRRSISQADIVDAAFDILEQKGFAAVSVRGVAAALGLTPTALYTYFDSKSALQAAMVEQLLTGVAEAASSRSSGEVYRDHDAPPAAWRDRVLALAVALRERLVAHAGAVVLITSGPLDGTRARDVAEALIAGFVDAGLDPDDAARAGHAVRAHVIGWVALETARRAAPEQQPEPETLWREPSRHPLVEASAHLALDEGDDGEFRWGVERLLDGLVRSDVLPAGSTAH